MEEQSVIDHIIEMKGDIASIKTTLDETLKPLVARVDSHETRLTATESDVRMWKRVFLSLWGVLVIAGTWAVSFF